MSDVVETLQQTTKPIENNLVKEAVTEEEIWIKIMEQNLNGVMFHSYESDLLYLLDLKGFSKMHEHQKEEEGENLDKLKHKYMEVYKKLPILHTSASSDKWKRNTDIDTEQKLELVKESMENYANWEAEVLEHLLKWKRLTSDKQLVHALVEDVMEEIKYIETMINILEEHNYHIDCINDMSEYLTGCYK